MKIRNVDGKYVTDEFTRDGEFWVSSWHHTERTYKIIKEQLEERFPSLTVSATCYFNNTNNGSPIILQFSDPIEEAEFIFYSPQLVIE